MGSNDSNDRPNPRTQPLTRRTCVVKQYTLQIVRLNNIRYKNAAAWLHKLIQNLRRGTFTLLIIFLNASI